MTKNATTDPDTGVRFYTWMGQDYLSVTSSRRLIGMPFNLHQWALSQVVDRAVDEAETVIAMRDRPAKPRERVTKKNARLEARRWLRAAATEKRDRAATRGTNVHEAIAQGTPLDALEPEVRVRVTRWQAFLTQTGAKVIWQERQLWNLTEGFAGTGDVLLQMPNGDVVVTDLKTSEDVYVDHAIQVMAYGMAEFVGEDNIIDAEATAWLKRANKLAILHLAPDGWTLYYIKPNAYLYSMFLLQLGEAKFLLANPTIDGLVESVVKHH
jgi:hypothetical protein